MKSNTFGNLFTVTTFGESHGNSIGGIIDGCPSGKEINIELIQKDLDRRKPGQSKIVTQRKENDKLEILSGIFQDKTTGAPISLQIKNKDQKSSDYKHISDTFRPSHADYTYFKKYGNRDHRGGGRSSARETANWVAAGAIAKQILKNLDIKINAYVSQVGNIKLTKHYSDLDFKNTEKNIVRCPDDEYAKIFRNVFVRAGMSEEDILAKGPATRLYKNRVYELPEFEIIKAGYEIESNDGLWIARTDSGHSPEHISLMDYKRKLYLSGDFLLPRISPNISDNFFDPLDDRLGGYFKYLNEISTMEPDTKVFPCHDWPFTNGDQRAKDLIKHHNHRLSLILDALNEKDITIMDSIEIIFDRKIGDEQMHFAIGEARAINSDLQFFKEKFIMPVEGIISGVYGSQRILNGKPRWPHYGIDIAAKQGTMIKSSGSGVVTMAEDDLYYTGGTVIMDHGHGISTIYSHLENVLVSVGDQINQGDIIGTVGSTGRSTGPHLDFRVNWFQTRLDPMSVLD